jgi:hypothetical protein
MLSGDVFGNPSPSTLRIKMERIVEEPNRWQKVIDLANYVEHLKAAEQHWSTNRMSWLLMSQTFCILAYISLISANENTAGFANVRHLLSWLLPLTASLISCATAISIYAAEYVNHRLIDVRVELAELMNELSGMVIKVPRVGAKKRDDNIRYTLGLGRFVLLVPVLLVIFWLSVLAAR